VSVRPLARLAAAALVIVLLGGCSAIRVAYENADTFVRWRAASYLDLQGEAADDLSDRIDAFHAWHRAQALPQYARLASEAAVRVEDGAISPEDIVWGYDSLMAQLRESLREAAERVAPVLDKLTAEQIERIAERFAEDNRKFARENMRGSEKERRHLRFKRTRERLEDWVGSLSDMQLDRVRRFADETPLFAELRDRDHKRLQAQVLEIVRARQAQKRLAEVALDWRSGRDPAYAAASEEFRKAYFVLIGDLDRTLDAEQRGRFVARLRGFAEDFTVLSAAGRERGEARAR
jgi:hypothetical protein